MKNLTKNILVWMILVFSLVKLDAQYSQETFTVDKDEALDVFFLRGLPEVNRDSLFANYREKLGSVAKRYSYQLLQFYKVNSTLQGGAQPTLMLIAKWDNLPIRLQFVDDIVQKEPRFHEMRRELYSRFDLTTYEMEDDIQYNIKADRYNVATAIWHHCDEAFANNWQHDAVEYGARIVLDLENGISPVGYAYNPDLFILSDWPSEEAYQQFIRDFSLPKCVTNINEFQF